MVKLCVSEEITAEEQKIFNEWKFEWSAVTVGLGNQSMKCPWNAQDDVILYAIRVGQRSCEQKGFCRNCNNSWSYSTWPNGEGKLEFMKEAFSRRVRSSFRHLNAWQVLKYNVTSKLFGAASSRPEDACIAFGSTNAVQFINAALMSCVVIVILSGHNGFPLTFFCLKPLHLRLIPMSGPTIGITAIKNVTSDWLEPQIWLRILELLAVHLPKFQRRKCSRNWWYLSAWLLCETSVNTNDRTVHRIANCSKFNYTHGPIILLGCSTNFGLLSEYYFHQYSELC